MIDVEREERRGRDEMTQPKPCDAYSGASRRRRGRTPSFMGPSRSGTPIAEEMPWPPPTYPGAFVSTKMYDINKPITLERPDLQGGSFSMGYTVKIP